MLRLLPDILLESIAGPRLGGLDARSRRRRIAESVAFLVVLAVGLALVAAVAGVLRGSGTDYRFRTILPATEQRWIESRMPDAILAGQRARGAARWGLDGTHGSSRFLVDEVLMTLTALDADGGLLQPAEPIGVWRFRAGWPSPMLELSTWSGERFTSVERDVVGPRLASLGLPGVPVGVVWSAFAWNVLVWTVLLWAVLRLGRAVRTVVRRDRGRCERCGHMLADASICPECGLELRPPGLP
jgi:hypothetical protein